MCQANRKSESGLQGANLPTHPDRHGSRQIGERLRVDPRGGKAAAAFDLDGTILAMVKTVVRGCRSIRDQLDMADRVDQIARIAMRESPLRNQAILGLKR